MSTTRSDTGENEAETHEDTVRAYLRSNDEVAKPTHLTGPSNRADAAA